MEVYATRPVARNLAVLRKLLKKSSFLATFAKTDRPVYLWAFLRPNGLSKENVTVVTDVKHGTDYSEEEIG